MSTIDRYLESFDLEPGYLDWASFGPMSRAVREEVVADLEMLGTGRRAGMDLVGSHRSEALEGLAVLLGMPADAIVFQPSTTDGLMQALFGVTGGVLVSRREFPSLTVAVTRAAESLHVVEPQWVDPPAGFMTPEVVAQHLTAQTRAVAVSLVDFRTGYRADLSAIRDVIGDRLLIVDAIQGFGVIDADYAAADVICGHGYKWLRAGRGTGFAAFGPRALEELTPVFSGRAGTDLDLPLDGVPAPSVGARRFTVSEPDPLAVSRLATAVGEVVDAGVREIERIVGERTQSIIELADRHGVVVRTPRDPERRAGIVALEPDAGTMGALSASLTNHGVAYRARSGQIRLSAHAGTGTGTLDLLGEALAAAAAAR